MACPGLISSALSTPAIFKLTHYPIQVVAERIPKTLWLMGITAVVTFVIGIPAGV